jgi:hypothetical protein
VDGVFTNTRFQSDEKSVRTLLTTTSWRNTSRDTQRNPIYARPPLTLQGTARPASKNRTTTDSLVEKYIWRVLYVQVLFNPGKTFGTHVQMWQVPWWGWKHPCTLLTALRGFRSASASIFGSFNFARNDRDILQSAQVHGFESC